MKRARLTSRGTLKRSRGSLCARPDASRVRACHPRAGRPPGVRCGFILPRRFRPSVLPLPASAARFAAFARSGRLPGEGGAARARGFSSRGLSFHGGFGPRFWPPSPLRGFGGPSHSGLGPRGRSPCGDLSTPASERRRRGFSTQGERPRRFLVARFVLPLAVWDHAADRSAGGRSTPAWERRRRGSSTRGGDHVVARRAVCLSTAVLARGPGRLRRSRGFGGPDHAGLAASPRFCQSGLGPRGRSPCGTRPATPASDRGADRPGVCPRFWPPSPLRGFGGPSHDGFCAIREAAPLGRSKRGRSNAARASSSERHSLPRANHIITASGCFAWICLNVGSSSSCVAERNAVGLSPKRIVQ